MKSDREDRNRRTAALLSLVVAGMFGFGFAMVPLYGLVCNALGIQSASQAVAAENLSMAAGGRMVTVKFDATVQGDVPWHFEPQTRSMRVQVGKMHRTAYEARNLSGETLTGQAVYSIVPWQAGNYFNKTDCFCFQRQTLAGGELRVMPLAFMVSPDLPQGIETLTLSYTFMNADAATRSSWNNRGSDQRSASRPTEAVSG